MISGPPVASVTLHHISPWVHGIRYCTLHAGLFFDAVSLRLDLPLPPPILCDSRATLSIAVSKVDKRKEEEEEKEECKRERENMYASVCM